jgi:uncharacterized protein
MRAVREIRPPGVYPAADEPRAKPLTVSDTRVAGFVGLAARGPLDEPVLLGGWNEFLDIYGHSNESYLARAVEGFFLNGGQTCYVVRVAHRARAGADGKVTLGPEHASCAERVVKDGWDKPTLRVRAMNEGRWGNNIWVRFQQTTAARTLLTLDLEVGSGEARVNAVKGFERGALVRIYDRENSDYVIVTEIDDRVIRWGAATPIVRRYRAAGPTYLAQGSARGVPRTADVAAVAPLCAADHQRRVAAGAARGSAVGGAAAAQSSGRGAGGEALRWA